MQGEPPLCFAGFRVDPANECLWRGHQAVRLRTKAFAVLHYLVEHPGRLLTKVEVMHAVWPGISVSDASLTVCIKEIRYVLGDDPRAPQFIETVHRRGYRFIAPLTPAPPVQNAKLKIKNGKSKPTPSPQSLAPTLVGREAELVQLHNWLKKALRGERQIVFVTGEPGIGKTAVVDAFVDRIATKGDLWIGQGQCIDHYGMSEGYLPLLVALEQLCREPGTGRLREILAQQAPTWLVQMPALLTAMDLEALQRRTVGATRERMLREMAGALEALTTERPLVLLLEDLHWSDTATLDLLAFLARRRQPCRLLVIGTYRPVEVLGQEHPLLAVMQELHVHGHCEELPLGLLTEMAVAEYLTVRFSEPGVPMEVARVIYQRTEGNPLFMVHVVEELVERGILRHRTGQWELNSTRAEAEGAVPATIRQLIERQLARLSAPEQQVLEAASVVGAEFAAAAVAAGVEAEVREVEAWCAGLAQRESFVRAHGQSEWPDGTISGRYRFLHALYQEVLYERVRPGWRAELHRRIGGRVEHAYGQQRPEVAAELAMHFERGGDTRRAVQYLGQAGENANQRSAHREAISLLTTGLALLQTLPDMPERSQQELTLQIALYAPLMVTKGYTAPEVENVLARARELCQQIGETPQLFPVLHGLWALYVMRAEHKTARELAEEQLRLTQRQQDPAFLLQSHYMLGLSLFYLEKFAQAREHAEQGMVLSGPQRHDAYTILYGRDLRASCWNLAAFALWALGYPDQALKRSQEALTLAQERAHPFIRGVASIFAATLHRFRREGRAAQKLAETTMTLATEQGFSLLLAWGTLLRGGALAEQGQGKKGITQMSQGLAACRAMRSELCRPYYLGLLAEAYGKVGRPQEGLTILSEALTAMQKTGERFSEAEMYRLKGELSLQSRQVRSKSQASLRQVKTGQDKSKVNNPQSAIRNPQLEAEVCFLKAIDIARRQSAKAWELRAVMSVSRLWQQQGRKDEARRLLAEIYGWFTEGFDTKDLQEAKALLDTLT